ncbi:hypothetical protein BIV24_21565 [Streptomyces colonosanans]|uniref:DUF3592 domain-containing protein n=1 Tax=Streptomyces colonosanans TaxID=1428652 RepID=A0A1S2P3U3_9ACTN|nr:hypothetical protein BIV24_21565 [Streptomyces colonosanans]
MLLEADGVRRRIPVAAIERVDVHGAKGRRLTVVLTGDEPAAYHLRCRSAPAVHEFAQAVRGALPVRDADERRQDGTGLVAEELLERATPNRVRLWWGLGGAYVLVLVLLLVKGAAFPGILWAVAPAVLSVGGLGVLGGWRVLREAWVLRTRGITVEGELQRIFWFEDVKQYTYAYVDSHGVRRELTGANGGDERVEIRYEPAAPETAQVGRRTTGSLVFGAVLILLLGVPSLLVGVALSLVGLVALGT